MQERYERVYEHESDLYAKDFPVAIIAGAMLKDTATGNVLAQLKLRNIGEKNVIACKVSVQAFENNGTEVEGVEEYSYLDIYATPGFDFGDKNPIYLPDAKARSFKARVTEVVFEDNKVMKAPSSEWKQVAPPRLIEDLLGDAELVKQYKLETGDDCKFIPEKKDGLFRCSCGAFSLETDNGCCKCGRSYVDLVSFLDAEKLRDAATIRHKAEEEKQQKDKQKKQKGIKVAIIALILAIILSAIGVTIKHFLDRNNEYNDAIKLKESGQYSSAKSKFESLDGWRDSEAQISECENLMMEESYLHAVELLNSGDYSNAVKCFEDLDGYKDSAECIKKAKYESAKEKMTEGDFSGAIALLEEIGNYEDSESLKKECGEKQAYQELSELSIRDDESIKRAEELLEIVPNGYEDVDEAKEVLEFYKPYIGDYKSGSVRKNFRVRKNKQGKWIACFGDIGNMYVEFEKPELSARDGNRSNDYTDVNVINSNRIEIKQVRPTATFNSVYTK